MFFWLVAGYVLAAVAFYSYIVMTAQEEPNEPAQTLAETPMRTLADVTKDWDHLNEQKKAA